MAPQGSRRQHRGGRVELPRVDRAVVEMEPGRGLGVSGSVGGRLSQGAQCDPLGGVFQVNFGGPHCDAKASCPRLQGPQHAVPGVEPRPIRAQPNQFHPLPATAIQCEQLLTTPKTSIVCSPPPSFQNIGRLISKPQGPPPLPTACCLFQTRITFMRRQADGRVRECSSLAATCCLRPSTRPGAV